MYVLSFGFLFGFVLYIKCEFCFNWNRMLIGFISDFKFCVFCISSFMDSIFVALRVKFESRMYYLNTPLFDNVDDFLNEGTFEYFTSKYCL